jgi:hypothetical protein
LRTVTEVDGRPVDLAAATDDLGADRAARLQALAEALEPDRAEPPTAPALDDPAAARERAAEVVGRDKYQESQLPRPFKGLLEWIADRLRPIGDGLDRLADRVPGGRFVLLGLLGAAIGWVAWWAANRTGRARVVDEGWSLVDPTADPAALDADADAAEAAGDHATAVRRRYEAGLLRLARAGRIELRPATTPAQVARALGDPTVDRLTATFEEVVYGGRSAFAVDAEAARRGWLEVLGAGARR